MMNVIYHNPFIISNSIDRIFVLIIGAYVAINYKNLINIKIANKRELFLFWWLIFNLLASIVGFVNHNSPFYILNDFIVYALIPTFYFVSKNKVKDLDFNKFIIPIIFFQFIALVLNIKTFYNASALIIAYLLYQFLNSKKNVFKNSIYLIISIVFSVLSPYANKSLLIQVCIIFLFLIFNKMTLNKFIRTILIIGLVVGCFCMNYEKIQQTSAYKKMEVFIETIFDESKDSNDVSTNGRIYEMKTVISNFKDLSFIQKAVGEGNGATLDFRTSPDLDTLISVYGVEGISNVHNVHVLFFSILNRHGIIGLFNIGILIIMILYSYCINRKSMKKDISFLFVICCLFDSFTAATHLFVNLLFMIMFTILLANTSQKGSNI
nr:hypothetical protein [Priestia aryabhattai]